MPDVAAQHADEVAAGRRFKFGDNWARFLSVLNNDRILQAERSLTERVGVPLQGKTFIDVGSGSGLFSLAARRLGAYVYSFDYDSQSVACVEETLFPRRCVLDRGAGFGSRHGISGEPWSI